MPRVTQQEHGRAGLKPRGEAVGIAPVQVDMRNSRRAACYQEGEGNKLQLHPQAESSP